ncbi:MAG: hypothetical protein R3B74_16120 [Nitrospirales bacterium]|nr:hypothetical protein [Nitrospirales bacterium]
MMRPKIKRSRTMRGLRFFANRNLGSFKRSWFFVDILKCSFSFLKKGMNVYFSLFVLGLGTNLISCEPLEAFEVNTHRQLTEKANEVIGPSLDAYLIDNLGVEGGLNASFNGMTARQWMVEGSETEDESLRPARHFHDPISNSGLGGFSSAIDWSLRPVGDQFPGGPWSWNDAREYYFRALTSPTKAERDENWGKTFRALGQVMHLLQDMASPAHVRNDPHLSFFGFGDDDGIHDYMEKQSVSSYLGGGAIGPDPSILQQVGATHSEKPVSNLFDHNINTTGLNPEATLGGQSGLAEYTNANFFSDDTVAGQNKFTPPHPSVAELVPATTIPFGLQYVTLSRLGSPSELKARVAKYTGNQSFSKFRLTNLELDLLNQLRLDDLVYEAQAINLIPRAVGYSAAVLDYFFRGDVETTAVFHVVSHFVALLPGGGVVCDETPVFEWGHLEFGFDVPASLGYDGMTAVYYDDKNKNRIKIPEESFGVIPLNQIPANQPVPWYVVLDGPMGPGAKEERAIVAKKHEAEWVFSCDH